MNQTIGSNAEVVFAGPWWTIEPSTFDLVSSTAEWCRENGSLEPPGLDLQPPDVRHLVETVELFDHLSGVTGISVEQIGEWFNTVRVGLEARAGRRWRPLSGDFDSTRQ